MRRARLLSLFVASLALTSGATAVARACPERPAPAPGAFFSAAGPITQSSGQIVRFTDTGGTRVVAEEHIDGALVGVSPDGRLLVGVTGLRIEGEDVPPCVATHVWVRLFDLTDDTSRRLGRLQGGAPRDVSFSPTGRYVAVAAGRAEEARVHLFDLEAGRRKWVVSGVEAIWLDEDRLLVREHRNRVSLHGRADGERVRVISPPARRMRPYRAGADDTGFWATTGRGTDLRFVRVHFDGTRARVETRDVALSARPQTISADGVRAATRTEGAVLVHDLVTGALLATIRGPAHYDAVALSDDGTTVAVIAGPVVELLALDGSAWMGFAATEPASELEPAETEPETTSATGAPTPPVPVLQ